MFAIFLQHRRGIMKGSDSNEGVSYSRTRNRGSFTMFTDVDITSNEQFQRKFRYINLIWFGVLTIYMGVFVIVVLLNKPSYFRDWHAVTIIGLSSLMIVIYLIRARVHEDQWPPRLFFALSIWLCIYFVVILLSTIDSDFAWCLYMVFGISFTLFSSRRLIIAVCIITL